MPGRDHVQALVGGDLQRVFARLLEIGANFEQLGAKGTHGGVLLDRIPKRDEDLRAQAMAASGKCDRLAMVATRRSEHAAQTRFTPDQCIHVDQAAAHLEGPQWCVVLMLDPGFGTERLVEQRPGVLRRGRHRLVDDGRSGVELGEGGQEHKHFLC
jgi:hypothetical protein